MSQSREKITAALEAAPARKSGRAVFDEGRTVWEWQTATGVFERYVSEEQMSRLEASNLQLLDPASQDAGCAIYGSQAARKQLVVTERLLGSRAAVSKNERTATVQSVSALRQFWRRLIPAT